MPRRILITAGPTHEPIDDVRYIANRSSGKMGIAIAEAAREAGWDVTLLLGPVEYPAAPSQFPRSEPQTQSPRSRGPGPPVRTLRFTTTEDLRTLLAEHFPECDVLVMAAAVADYRPMRTAGGKIERGEERLTLELEPTPDLVAECAKSKRPDQFIIGFALEELDKLRDRALEKLKRKGLDAIVANPLRTIGSENIEASLFYPNADQIAERHPRDRIANKQVFAEWIIVWLGETIKTAQN